MQSKWQDQVLIFAPWHADGEMIVNAFIKAIQNGKSQSGRQMDFDLFVQISGPENVDLGGIQCTKATSVDLVRCAAK